MDWFYSKSVRVLRETDGYLYHGEWVDGTLQEVLSLVCDVQPANREQIYKDYGYYIDCQIRIFCDICDLRIGDIAEHDGQQYKVDKIIKWDDYLDVFAKDYPDVEGGQNGE